MEKGKGEKETCLIIASGHTATKAKQLDLSDVHVVVVNNAYRAYRDFDTWVMSPEFWRERGQFEKIKDNQEVVRDYNDFVHTLGGLPVIGYAITIVACYWTLHRIQPKRILFLGCDMVYDEDERGNTAFYGVGTDMRSRRIPDPDFMFKNHSQTIESVYGRFAQEALSRCVELVNISDVPNSRLPYPQQPFASFVKKS